MEPTTLADALRALKGAHVEEVLLPILVQLIVIVLVARVASYVFRKLGQSGVVGEIAAGLILGPSLLSQFTFIHDIFHPHISNVDPALADEIFKWIFTGLSQIGLILLLFLIGLEFDFSHLKRNGRAALAIAVLGVIIPFGLGVAIAPVLYGNADLGAHPAASGPPPFWHFALFLGTALSITALPVLGRILMELNIHRTRIGAITITAAAIEDAMGWIMLAAVAAIVQGAHGNSGRSPANETFVMLVWTIAFALAMIFLVRPLLVRGFRRLMTNENLGVTGLAILLCVILGCSIVTNLIGIFAIFGAFLCGAVLSGERDFVKAVRGKLSDFITAFFLPIFFTYTGIRTNVQALGSFDLWLLCGLVLTAAIVGKVAGGFFAAKVTGFSRRESICIGVMMNTRGLMELIVINVGYDLRVIPPSVFAMLVLMALITTVMTTPLLARFLRGTECEKDLMQSPFMKGEEAIEEDDETPHAAE